MESVCIEAAKRHAAALSRLIHARRFWYTVGVFRHKTAIAADCLGARHNNKGIYEYLLSGGLRREKLNLRQFDDDEKRAAYETQKGICPRCGLHFEIEEMEGDHVVPWSKGGKTVPENLQMLCRRCNALKGDK